MNITGTVQEFVKLFSCSKPKRIRLWLITFGPDESMKGHMLVTLVKPIKPGFRRPFTLTPDEPIDIRSDGGYLGVEVVEGDSTITLKDQSATQVTGWVNGDGSVGTKLIRLKADGHIGTGEVEVTVDIAYEVAHPDATVLDFKESVTDEPIPTT